jgi:hypothetical protein
MDTMPKRRPWVFTLEAGWVWAAVGLLLFWAVLVGLVWLWLS